MNNIQFLKLGGSLITEKDKPHAPRLEVIRRLAEEIAQARYDLPSLRLVLGHGSGSFGHVPAQKYGTRLGVRTPEEWQGFVQVWREASALNRLVVEALAEAGLPALSFPPSASVTAVAGRVSGWDLAPLQAALEAGLLPVLFGDVVFDTQLGGTILSTEDLFATLVDHVPPARLLLTGLEPGVWADYPACTRLLDQITPQDMKHLSPSLQGSGAVDVTGGMASKVALSMELAGRFPGLEVRIFSGEQAGAVYKALLGASLGTLIHTST
jgi:isopentenyl phosphate kinase